MDNLLNILSVSPKLYLGDPEKNSKIHLSCLRDYSEYTPDIILFPELSLTGYTCGDYFRNMGFIDQCKDAAECLVRETHDIPRVFIFGCPIIFDQKLYNCAIVAFKGKVIGIVPKTYLPNYNEFYEVRWFDSGKNIEEGATVSFDNVEICFGQRIFEFDTEERFGIEICEDLWSNEPVSDKLFRNGAHVVLNLSASNELIGKADYRRQLVMASSARNVGAYFYCSSNSGESSSESIFSGHKISVELGNILTDQIDFENKTSVSPSQFDIQKINFERLRMNTFVRERTLPLVKIPMIIASRSQKLFAEPAMPFVPKCPQKITEVHHTLHNILKFALIRRISHVNANAAIIGLSGGLDSTLALLALVSAYKEMGRDMGEIRAISMPGPGTGSRTKSNARELATSLGCSFQELDISSFCETHMKMIEKDLSILDRTYENVQARIRTLTLMNIANNIDGIVIGTGDLSEAALGWCTYSGDHISMYHINSGVPKTLVKFMVAEYAKLNDFKSVSNCLFDIIDTPISPELLPSEGTEIKQKTEEIIGNYELNDFFLFNYLRHGFSCSKLLSTAIQTFNGKFEKLYIEQVLDIFMNRFFANQFKRNNSTEGPKIGSVNLSPRGDWRMPSDIYWNCKED